MAGGRIFMDVTGLLNNTRIREALLANSHDQDPLTAKILRELVEENQKNIEENKKSLLRLVRENILKVHPWSLKYLLSFLPRALWGLISPEKAREKSLNYGEKYIEKLQQESQKLKTRQEKLEFIKENSADVFTTGFSVLAYIAVSSGYIDKVREILESYQLDTEELSQVEKSLPYNVTTEMGMKLLKIAKKLDQNGEKPAVSTPEIQEFLAEYGQRSSVEVDLGVPNWNEEPDYIVKLVQSYIDNQSYQQGLDNFYHGRQKAEEAILNITARVKERAGKRKAKKVNKLLRAYREMFGLRELSKLLLTQALQIFRDMFKEIAKEMVAEGKIKKTSDIFYLNLEQLEAENEQDLNLNNTVKQNREIYQRQLKLKAPRVITGTGECFHFPREEENETVMQGIPVSAGLKEGKVRILHSPEEGDRLSQGEILVTRGTNPSWTPLFLNSGALIMETGGPISHGSVVAREYGIPAVVGVKDAVNRLQDGQQVRVNGERGTVEILE